MWPNEHVKTYDQIYPYARALYEKALEARGKALPDWPDWCYAPLATSYAVISDACRRENISSDKLAADVGNLGALAAWRMTRGTYRFSPELLEDLWQAEITEIPSDVLLAHMPAWCVYIDTTKQDWGWEGIDGFFAYLESDANDGHAELRITFDIGKGLVSQAINLTKEKLTDCLLDTAAEGAGHIPAGELIPFPTNSEVEEIARRYSRLIAPLLYLCSDEPDIAPSPGRPAHPRFEYHSTVQYRVGFSPAPDVPVGTHASPHPHIRRAHWHLYRVGPGRTETRLLWVKATPVGF